MVHESAKERLGHLEAREVPLLVAPPETGPALELQRGLGATARLPAQPRPRRVLGPHELQHRP
eukprot:11117930-Lingulodinium_polyedra.AAC.1